LVKVVPDSADEKILLESEGDKETIYLKITSIKPLFDGISQEGSGGGGGSSSDPEAEAKMEMGVNRFYFSTPFTHKASVRRRRRNRRNRNRSCKHDDTNPPPIPPPPPPPLQGSAHGSTSEQYKRTTELVVAHPFPHCTSRQVVIKRVVTVQSPIECALDDVRQRCGIMRDLLAKPNDKTNKNIMMQLLQGSVVPQVRVMGGGEGGEKGALYSSLLSSANTTSTTTTTATTTTTGAWWCNRGGTMLPGQHTSHHRWYDQYYHAYVYHHHHGQAGYLP